MSKKLVLIGAGSAMFTQGLIVDIIKEQSLGPWEIGLVDIDPKALKVAYNLAKKMIETRKIFSANLPNNGTIPSLPSYAVLEMPAVASGRGFLPLHADYFPDYLAAIINKRLACVELTVDAALKGNGKLMVEAMLADGAVRDQGVAEKLTDELLKAHKEFLPQFS